MMYVVWMYVVRMYACMSAFVGCFVHGSAGQTQTAIPTHGQTQPGSWQRRLPSPGWCTQEPEQPLRPWPGYGPVHTRLRWGLVAQAVGMHTRCYCFNNMRAHLHLRSYDRSLHTSVQTRTDTSINFSETESTNLPSISIWSFGCMYGDTHVHKANAGVGEIAAFNSVQDRTTYSIGGELAPRKTGLQK